MVPLSDLPRAFECLNDEDEDVRLCAQMALGSNHTSEDLNYAMSVEDLIRVDACLDALVRILEDPHARGRATAASLIGEYGERVWPPAPQHFVDALVDALEDPDEDVARHACSSLARSRFYSDDKFVERALPRLVNILRKPNRFSTHGDAATILGKMYAIRQSPHWSKVESLLAKRLREANDCAKEEIAEAMLHLKCKNPESIAALRHAVEVGNERTRQLARKALHGAEEAVKEALEDEDG